MDDLKEIVMEFQEQRKILNSVLKENDIEPRIGDVCNELMEQRMVLSLVNCLKLDKGLKKFAEGAAKNQKVMYDSLVRVGFTKKQAIDMLGEEIVPHSCRGKCSEGDEVDE